MWNFNNSFDDDTRSKVLTFTDDAKVSIQIKARASAPIFSFCITHL